ncbi:MAG: hypothetical protein GTO40_26840 [Deltaproteobacteria bacterium]|nr:hypothetical protein [Deltaproteobacteria bacterium]
MAESPSADREEFPTAVTEQLVQELGMVVLVETGTAGAVVGELPPVRVLLLQVAPVVVGSMTRVLAEAEVTEELAVGGAGRCVWGNQSVGRRWERWGRADRDPLFDLFQRELQSHRR